MDGQFLQHYLTIDILIVLNNSDCYLFSFFLYNPYQFLNGRFNRRYELINESLYCTD